MPPHFLLPRARTSSRSEAGVALLEVLVTAVVVGIAAIGVVFMFSFGNTWVVAKGDDRVAVNLAQQKIEQLRGGGYAALPVVRTPASGWNCVTPSGSTCGPSSDRQFNWITCVQNVTDTNVSLPNYIPGGTPGVPSTYTYIACAPGAVTTTKRITVIVQPIQQLQADPPVVLQAWITATVTPGGF